MFVAILKEQSARLNAWRSVSTGRRVFAAILVVVVMTGIGKLAVVARELVVARYFGTGDAVDAFLIAFLFPMVAINVLAGSFSAAMMPVYIRTKDRDGEETARRLFSTVMALGAIFLAAVAFLLAAAAPVLLPLLGSGFSAKTMMLTQSLFYWLLPTLVLAGMGHLYATAMNADERFAVVALAPAITPICAMGALVFLVDKWGIYALAGGTLGGAAVELAVLANAAARRRIPLLPRWHGMTDELREVVDQYIPMVAGAFLMSGTVLVDQAMAAMLEPGSVAAFNYGTKVVSMILSIAAMGLGTAVLPYFSRMVSNGDWKGVRHTFFISARLIIFLTVPVTVLLFLFSDSIISMLFERGAFTEKDTGLVGQVQAFYVMQIPFYMLGILGVRLLSAVAKNQVLMRISLVNLFVNIAGNYVCIQYFGLAGIALSTALVYALSLAMIYVALFNEDVRMNDTYG